MDGHELSGTSVEGKRRVRLLVGASGAGNVINLPAYLHAMRGTDECTVRVLMTQTAASIMPTHTIGLVSDGVFCDGPSQFEPGHVELATWADQFVVLPATAHTLAQAANGLAGNLLTSAILAYGGPVIFFPSMNELMWANRAVQRNVERLRDDGHRVVEPELVRTWEIASGTMRELPGLPPPAVVARMVADATVASARSTDPGRRTGQLLKGMSN